MLSAYSYGTYLLISIFLTIWVARTLHRNGRIFLVDAFKGNEPLADSVNHLLVVGFYLINLGYVSLALKQETLPVDLTSAIESVSAKVGWVMVILGGMHFFNIYVFNHLRVAARDDAPAAENRSETLEALREVKGRMS